jgi:rhamnulose-1-phosphate aldolase
MIDLTSQSPLADVIRDAQEVSGSLWDRGWAESNAGNLSIDVTEACSGLPASGSTGVEHLPEAFLPLAGRTLLVTGSGRRFRDFARDAERNSQLLRFDDHGGSFSPIWGGLDVPGFRPTSELPAHLRLHAAMVEMGSPHRVVLHTHPTELIALSHLPDGRNEAKLNQILWSMLPEVKVFLPQGVGLVRYRAPGSDALARETEKKIRQGRTVALWQFHGCLAVDASAGEAFDRIDTANKAAKVALLCRAAGHRQGGLGPRELAELERLFGD